MGTREVDAWVLELREQAEDADVGVRTLAVCELIARGHYLAYADAKYAARCALTGAHARDAA